MSQAGSWRVSAADREARPSVRLRARQDAAPCVTPLLFLKDAANLCTLAGLLCALLGIYFAVLRIFPAAIVAMMWALLFDWYDGVVARRTPGRSDRFRAVGGQLDSLTDIVSFGICPAVILLAYGGFSAWFLPGAFVLIAACALRLGYFNAFGMASKSSYTGLAADNNAMVLAVIFLFEGIVSHSAFTITLYATIVLLAVAMVAPIRTPKLGGWWYPVITAGVVMLTVVYGLQLAG